MIFRTAELSGRERYELLTSLVVPRPIAWVSTRSEAGAPNLAPFSYFAALASSPFLVGISIGSREGEPKDSLRNIRATGAFCVNVVTEAQLEAMNASAGEWGAEVNEFERAGVHAREAEAVQAPYVLECPAVLECRVFKEVTLEGSPNTLVIGEVLLVRLADAAPRVPGKYFVDSVALDPVGRLWGDWYALLGETRSVPRPPPEAG